VSGIAAIWRRNGAPVDASVVSGVTDALLPAQSPARVWRDGAVAFASRGRGAAGPPDAACPLRDPATRTVLVADARLDNAEDLARELELPPSACRDLGDHGLILRAWRRWGEGCASHLVGDFAFVVWDEARQAIFAARDPSGIRPLYYHLSPSLFVVASGTPAILAVLDVPRRLDEVTIAGLLVPAIQDRVRTAFEAVSRLPPGHRLRVSPAGHMTDAFWEFDPARVSPARTDEEHAEAFRELFTAAVRARLRGAIAPAAALSGGLDSSSVVVVARALWAEAGRPPLGVYSATFPSIPACDEGAFADAVIRQGGVTPRPVPSDRLDPLAEIEESPRTPFETFPSPGYYMHTALYRAAHADGRTLLLEGTSGDFVTSHGQGHLYDLARAGRWLACYRHAREVSRTFRQPMRRTLNPLILMAVPPGARLWLRQLGSRGVLGETMIAPAFARRVDLDARLAERISPPIGRELEGVRYYHWLTLLSPKIAHVQETLARSAAEAGLEICDPFGDRRLMAFCLALPPSQKVQGTLTRVVVRRALADRLPPLVRDRPGKTRLDVMLAAGLAAYGHDRLQRLLADAPDVVGAYVRPEFIARVRRAALEPDLMRHRHAVWRLAVLTLLVRRAMASSLNSAGAIG
jgi:asparagine synthase (glutamine-hydrolysing)